MLLSSIVTLSLAVFVLASPQHETRALPPKAAVITSCTVPKTVALTFVRNIDDVPYLQ
jgi:hypothetical protein